MSDANKERESGGTSIVGMFCRIIGGFSLVIGGIMTLFGAAQLGRPAPDAASFLLVSCTLLISSIFWFAMGRGITLLSEIERNTRK